MPSLMVIKGHGSNEPQTIPLVDEVVCIGRGNECQILLLSSAVSRHHACITCDNGVYILEDKKSRGGTYLNGERIMKPDLLLHNDEIRICDFVMVFLNPNP
jgi:sigma-B regulation protein RsbU (phosphoserine phosphatase)